MSQPYNLDHHQTVNQSNPDYHEDLIVNKFQTAFGWKSLQEIADKIHTLLLPFSFFYLDTSNPRTRNWVCPEKKIKVTTSYKAASRTISSMLDHAEGWQALNTPEHSMLNNVTSMQMYNSYETHNVIREPLFRVISGFNYFHMMCLQQGLTNHKHNIDLLELKWATDDHSTPQFTNTLYRFDGDDVYNFLERMNQVRAHLYTVEGFEENREFLTYYNVGFWETVYRRSWMHYQDMFDVKKVPKSTNYWAYENAQRTMGNDIMYHLAKNLDMLDDDMLKRPLQKRNVGAVDTQDPFTGEVRDTANFISHNFQKCKLIKESLIKDYEWIDSLTFENTEDGKPAYNV